MLHIYLFVWLHILCYLPVLSSLLSIYGHISWAAPVTCPDNSWVALTGNCYKVFDERKTWDAANDECISEGAHLLTLETAEEATATSAYITSENKLISGMHS